VTEIKHPEPGRKNEHKHAAKNGPMRWDRCGLEEGPWAGEKEERSSKNLRFSPKADREQAKKGM